MIVIISMKTSWLRMVIFNIYMFHSWYSNFFLVDLTIILSLPYVEVFSYHLCFLQELGNNHSDHSLLLAIIHVVGTCSAA